MRIYNPYKHISWIKRKIRNELGLMIKIGTHYTRVSELKKQIREIGNKKHKRPSIRMTNPNTGLDGQEK